MHTLGVGIYGCWLSTVIVVVVVDVVIVMCVILKCLRHVRAQLHFDIALTLLNHMYDYCFFFRTRIFVCRFAFLHHALRCAASDHLNLFCATPDSNNNIEFQIGFN